jgi:hypothetical protein
MADVTATTAQAFPAREESKMALGGSLTEASSGAAAVVLAILGLLHIAPAELMSIATIVVGASLLLLGAVIGARFASGATSDSVAARELVSEGMVMEWLCGLAGIVLGVLALVGTAATTLVPVATIVFGAGLLVASGTVSRLAPTTSRQEGHPHEAIYITPAPGVLIAFAGTVLGILALSGFNPVILSLVAMLSFGVAVILTGTSFAGIIYTTFATESSR